MRKWTQTLVVYPLCVRILVEKKRQEINRKVTKRSRQTGEKRRRK